MYLTLKLLPKTFETKYKQSLQVTCQAEVVQMVDSAIKQINHYPAVLKKPTELSIG